MYPYISFKISSQQETERLAELAKKSPLFEAVLSDEPKSLEHLEKLLLEKGEAHKEEIANTSTEWGDSLLMLAVYKGHYDKALFLMKAGARVDTFNRENVGVLRIICRFNIGPPIQFIYYLLFEAKGKENIKKMSLPELTPDINCLDALLCYVSYLFVVDMKKNPKLFSYYHEVFKKLLALGANPVFPDGTNIFHLVMNEFEMINFSIILGLIKIFDKNAKKLLSQVNIDNAIFHEKLCQVAIRHYDLRLYFPTDETYYFSALKVLAHWIKKKMQPQWEREFSNYRTFMTDILPGRKDLIASRPKNVGMRFHTLEYILQLSNLKTLDTVVLDEGFYDFGYDFSYSPSIELEQLNFNVEDKLKNFLNALKMVKYKPKEMSVCNFAFSEEFIKAICLFPIQHLTLDITGTLPKELMHSPAEEIELDIYMSNFSKALEILGQNKNLKMITMTLSEDDEYEEDMDNNPEAFSKKRFALYEDMLQATVAFFAHKKNLTSFDESDYDQSNFFDTVAAYLDPIYKTSDISPEQEEILKKQQEKILTKMEELFDHLSTCTLLEKFIHPLFYGTNPEVFEKLKSCLSSNYSLISTDLLCICGGGGKLDPDGEEFNYYRERNKAFAPLLNLYNQWVGLLPLDPKFQISSLRQALPEIMSLDDDDVEMEPEPQRWAQAQKTLQSGEHEGKRAKEESLLVTEGDIDSRGKGEKETKMSKESPGALEEMAHYAETLAPAIKEKLLQAMIDLIPNIEEKYRNECCYILANEFLLNRLEEEGMAAKILKLIPPPPVTIDPRYQKAQNDLSFMAADPKTMLAHLLESGDENIGYKSEDSRVERVVASMHTDKDGDAIMAVSQPACYRLSRTGQSIAEFVDYSSKQYLATVKEKGKAEEELKKTQELKAKLENDLQEMQGRLQQMQQMIAEKDAEINRLQGKPLSFSSKAHKRKGDEMNLEEEGRENPKRLKT